MSEIKTVFPESTLPVATAISVSEDADGALMSNVVTMDNGILDTNNSTETPLGIDGVFTGVGVDVLEYATIIISVTADAASATDGVEFQFSTDNSTWKTTDNYTYTNGGVCKTWGIQTVAPYFRIKYTNGGTAQTAFNLCVQLKRIAGVITSHRVADDVEGQDDAALTKTILMAEKAGGVADVYTNVQSTAGGNLKVSLEEVESGVVVPVVYDDTFHISEFGELRVAQAGNRADVEFVNDKQPLLVDDISSGSGTATHQTNSRDVALAVGGAVNGATGGLRLHYNVPYTPGSGQEIDITGALDAAAIGGGAASVFIRSSVTGSEVVTDIEQGDWIAATSGVDWSKSQIFRMSFQSLKVGRIQFSLVRNGIPVKVAEVNNDNVRTGGYWQYPSLPLYWKLYNTATDTICEIGYGDDSNGIGFRYKFGSVQATATARAICGTVKSQGGQPLFSMPGFQFATSNKNTAKTVSTTLIPVLSIQVAATINSIANKGLYIPEAFSLQVNNPIRYQVLYRPTLTGASFAAVDATYSGMSVDTSATAITGGVLIDEDYLSSGINQVTGEEGLLGRIIMALGYSATSDIVTIAAIRTGATDATAYAKIKWREIR